MAQVEEQIATLTREVLELRQALYRSGLDSAGHNRTHGNEDHVGVSSMKAPYTMTPSSLYSVGADIAAYAFAAPASVTWGTANRAIYIPFWLPEAVTLTQIFWYNGAVAAGNTDCAVYDSTGTQKISTGSTAMAGANAIQSVNVADTALAAGSYYLALSNNSTTDAFFCWTITAAQGVAMGLAQQTTAFPLPDPATLATNNQTRIPICGFTVRSFV